MRNSNHIDLRTQGGSRSSGALAPGASVQYIFDPQQARIGASSSKPALWNCVRGIWLQGSMIVVRSSGGTTPIYADQFTRCIKSIGLTSNMFGTLFDPTIIDGTVARHIVEYFGNGYQRAGINRQPIPGTDGTYTRTFELFLPFAQGLNDDPDHFDFWLGWLNDAILEIFVQDAANPFGVSAGVTITSVTFNTMIEMVPWPELIIPPWVAHRNYRQAASAASNGPKLVNAGDAGPLQGVDDGSRLEAMLFAHQSGGFNGSGTADQISAIAMQWRDQAQSTLPQFFFARFLRACRMAKLGYTSAVVDVYDNTEPYPMVANPGTGPLNDASAFYTPLVWQEKGSQISYMQKFKGNYPLDQMTFGSSQSGSFNIYTRELKQFSVSKCTEMVAAAGIDPSTVQLVPKLSKKNIKPIDPSKAFCLPRAVVQKKAA